jgi:hypothetical protein
MRNVLCLNNFKKWAGLVRVLDLSKNKLEDGEHLVKVLKALPLLSCLYLSGNPCIRNIPNYRKVIPKENSIHHVIILIL